MPLATRLQLLLAVAVLATGRVEAVAVSAVVLSVLALRVLTRRRIGVPVLPMLPPRLHQRASTGYPAACPPGPAPAPQPATSLQR